MLVAVPSPARLFSRVTLYRSLLLRRSHYILLTGRYKQLTPLLVALLSMSGGRRGDPEDG
jgi:hypothetical protein